jgi:nucleoside-diphosphate-sugar epimerase
LGASGFIGSRAVKALEASDWAIPIPASRRSGLKLDATDAAQLKLAMNDTAGVVNCVAGAPETIIKNARALFSAAASMPQRPRVVHLSSMAVYGAAVGLIDEAHPAVGELSPYGSAKLEAELLAKAHASTVILRPGIVYGPESAQWSARIAQLLCAHRLGDLGSGGDGHCNLVYVEDVVEAIVQGLRRPDIEGRPFNLSTPAPPTWNEYFIRYAQALGAVPVSRIGRRRLRIEGKLLAPPLKIAEILLSKASRPLARRLPQPIAPSLLRLFAQEIALDVSSAERALGMRWTPLDEGLRQSAAWYRG